MVPCNVTGCFSLSLAVPQLITFCWHLVLKFLLWLNAFYACQGCGTSFWSPRWVTPEAGTYGKAIKILEFENCAWDTGAAKLVPTDNIAAGRTEQFNVCNKIWKCARLALWPKIQGSNLLHLSMSVQATVNHWSYMYLSWKIEYLGAN